MLRARDTAWAAAGWERGVSTALQRCRRGLANGLMGLAELLTPAELDINSGRTRPMRQFMEEFKGGKDIQG